MLVLLVLPASHPALIVLDRPDPETALLGFSEQALLHAESFLWQRLRCSVNDQASSARYLV